MEASSQTLGKFQGFRSSNATITVDGAGSNITMSIGGSIDVGSDGGSSGAPPAGAATLTVSNGGTIAAPAEVRVFDGALNIGAAAGNGPVAPGNVTTPSLELMSGTQLVLNHNDNSGSYTLLPVISGDGQISAYNGTTVLTGDKTYSGGTNLNGGTLSVSRDTNLGAASGPLNFNGGALATTASFDTARTTTLNACGGTIDVANGSTLTMNGVIGGGGALTKADSGTLALTGNNTYRVARRFLPAHCSLVTAARPEAWLGTSRITPR